MQRLRKKAGLQATDAVHVYIELAAAAAAPGAPDVAAALASQAGYVRESLGVAILPASQRPAEEGEELGREQHELGGEEGKAEFTLVLTRPAGGGSSGGAVSLAGQLQQQAL